MTCLVAKNVAVCVCVADGLRSRELHRRVGRRRGGGPLCGASSQEQWRRGRPRPLPHERGTVSDSVIVTVTMPLAVPL